MEILNFLIQLKPIIPKLHIPNTGQFLDRTPYLRGTSLNHFHFHYVLFFPVICFVYILPFDYDIYVLTFVHTFT